MAAVEAAPPPQQQASAAVGGGEGQQRGPLQAGAVAMGMMQCNSCSATFYEETARNSHYRSEWHRYNLKRRVAGLPGVTEEWFEQKKQAAASLAASLASSLGAKREGGAATVFECSLCNKKYASRRAHDNHLQSRSHLDRAAKVPAGQATSALIVRERKQPQAAAAKIGDGSGRGAERDEARNRKPIGKIEEGNGNEDREGEEEEEEDEDDWEEVEDEEEAAQILEEHKHLEGEDSKNGRKSKDKGKAKAVEGATAAGDEEEDEDEEEGAESPGRCLFCLMDFGESGVEECVAHMHRQHGFFIPDAEYLDDLEGMLGYLALKINRGRMCLFCDDRGRAFPSAAAVRAHMSAKSHCKLRYGDGSGAAEEELAEFYDFSSSYEGTEQAEDADEEGAETSAAAAAAAGVEDALSKLQLVEAAGSSSHAMVPSSASASAAAAAPHLSLRHGGAELVIRRTSGGGKEGGSGAGGVGASSVVVVGSREFARYYKQKPKPQEGGNQRLISAVVARYRAMGLATSGLTERYTSTAELRKRDTAVKASIRAEQFRTRTAIANNVIRNLPKNVPY